MIWYPKGEIFLIGELYFADKKHHGLKLTPREQARRIKVGEVDDRLIGRVRPGPADNMIFHKEPGHQSIADEMAKEGILYCRADKSPGSRIIGCSLMRQRLQNSTSEHKERPGFRVFKNCVHTIRTVPSLERDDKNTEDVDTDQEDHIWDVIRYRLLHANTAVREIPMYGT